MKEPSRRTGSRARAPTTTAPPCRLTSSNASSGYGAPPSGFEAVFDGHAGYTDIDQRYIPSRCRNVEL